MAREAWLEQTVSIAPDGSSRIVSCPPIEPLERFANLVAAAERERIKWDTIHSCHPECDKPVCVAMRKAVAEEREACAVIAFNAKTYLEAAAAIRARREQ